MTEICITRHGQTDWNKQNKIQGISDIPLNETGRTQANTAAEHLKKENWDIIYTSPLIRAVETAEIIAQSAGIPSIITENDLKEFNFGVAEGMDMKERKTIYPDRNLIPGGEKLDEINVRAKNIINLIAKRHRGKRIIIVSHACFIMEVLEIFSEGKINGRKTQLKNLSMSLLTKDIEWDIPWYNRSIFDYVAV